LGCIFAVAFVVGIIYACWIAADSSGYVSHTAMTDITVSPGWMVGESKVCTSPVLNSREATPLNKPDGYAISLINCDDSSAKTFKVVFYGRTAQPEYEGVVWNCARNELSWDESAAFTCKETFGFRTPVSPSR
jgi:hypothetical protein